MPRKSKKNKTRRPGHFFLPGLPKIKNMWLEKLKLTNFRSYSKAEFSFASKTNLILGSNAIGKTNLLEAIYLLGTGLSFRAEVAGQMISWQKDFGVAEGKVKESQEEVNLLIQLQKTPGGLTKKNFLLDGLAKSRKLFLPNFFTVCFRPEDIRLVSGPPERRRKLIDEILLVLDWRYQQSLRVYNKALKQRNRLLDEIKERKSQFSELFYWDSALIKNGQFLTEQRKKLVDFFNQFLFSSPHQFLSQISLAYLPNPVTSQRLRNSLKKDVESGYTGVGPHKDIFFIESRQFKAANKNIAFWGSRAQQRLAVLGLKLAQLEHIYQQTKRRPVLLLDDIFSELDPVQQKLLQKIFTDHQVIITSSHPLSLDYFSFENQIVLKEDK
ncbi:MAG: DNA replication and repair protein RecF [Candidatus Shapirobacteria bacterium]